MTDNIMTGWPFHCLLKVPPKKGKRIKIDHSDRLWQTSRFLESIGLAKRRRYRSGGIIIDYEQSWCDLYLQLLECNKEMS